MKQTATNQFNDGLNYDLHPIVTPNSVLTDNLNGTFITYNGNEFCLQNDRGNTIKATLTNGFVPIGIKEHNGVLYIISYNEKTGEGEIGTYPGIDWTEREKWKSFGDYYSPLKNFIQSITYYMKTIKNFHGYITTNGTYKWNDSTKKIFSEQFGNFIEVLKTYFPEDSETQVNNFLNNPIISDSQPDELKAFLWQVINAEKCSNKYGVPALNIDYQDADGTYHLYFPKFFIGDTSDLVEFNQWYETELSPAISEHGGEYPNFNELINKYGFVKKLYYNLFSFNGLEFSYDPTEESSSEWNENELKTILQSIESILRTYYSESIDRNKIKYYYKVEYQDLSTGKINWDKTSFSDLRSTKFNFDLEHPVNIEVQDSYDGSVNLILTDDKNPPRIINTEFSVDGDRYKLIKREERDYLYETLFDTGTGLIKNPVSFASFSLDGIRTGGQLKGGNYTFYAKLGDADGNQSDIVAESGIVSIYKGNIDKPSTISGTLSDERTDKLISLTLENITEGYSKVYLYYTREYSDTQGFLMEESARIEEPYDIVEVDGKFNCKILVTGFENTNSISVEDLNIDYHTIDRNKTATQQQGMLFLGNIGNITYDYSKFGELAKLIKTSISCSNPDEESTFDYINPVGSRYSEDGEYYNIQNIYSKVGYWPNEYYRFGVVFILADGQSSPVFNMNGGEVGFGEGKKEFEGEYANEYGVFHTPAETKDTMIIETSSIIPWHFKFDCSEMIQKIVTELDERTGLYYADIIKGYYIVRQKRIPEVITQGLHIPIDYYSHTPIVPWKARIGDNPDDIKFTGPAIESFVDDDYLLKYRAETIDGGMIKPTRPYTKAVQIVLNYYGHPSVAAQIIAATLVFVPLGVLFNHLAASPVKRSETVFAYINFDEDGNFQGIEGIYENNFRNVPIFNKEGTKNLWYDSYNYSNGSGSSNPWIFETPKNWEFFSWIYLQDTIWNTEKKKALDRNTTNNLASLITSWYQVDPDYQEMADAQYFFGHHLIGTIADGNASGILSVEAMLNPSIKGRLDGSIIDYEVVRKCSAASDGEDDSLGISGRHQWMQKYEYYSNSSDSASAVYVNSNNIGKSVGDNVFATVIGNASSAADLITIAIPGGDIRRNVVRGRFAPFIGIDKKFTANSTDPLEMEIVQLAKRETNIDAAVSVREQDNSPYYVVSDRTPIIADPILHVYRGDCFVVSETVRMVTNFIDPTYPVTENIVDENSWKDHYLKGKGDNQDTNDGDDPEPSGDTDWDEINTTDVNTVSLGHWVTFKCLASSNIGLRSEDPFDTMSANIIGNPRSFYPLSSNTSTAGKQQDSELFNSGYGITVGQTRHIGYVKVPYIKQEYSNRILFSNKHVTDAFVNGYRVFQGLAYQDYDKQYGAIVKLLPWGNNLFCAFEHGLAILPINEKALIQTTTEQTIHIYGHGVLPDQMSIVSQDYGTKYADSIIRTPIGIYGVDVDAKKIWRFSDKQGFETLSDMKVESFLNETLADYYNISVGSCDVRSHYNSFKGDVIFTWYVNGEYYSICFNERQSLWTTRYDWVPIVSENRNGEFYSLQFGEDSNDRVGVYQHEIEQSTPTKWYGKQHPFEFEFVVSDPIGVQKIYENLQIVSNNVQPEELTFEFIGDSYFFNKTRIYHTVFEKDFSKKRRFSNEFYRNLKVFVNDPSRTDDASFTKPNLVKNQSTGYKPFRNTSILNDRNNVPNIGRIEQTTNATKEYRLIIPQECRNIETWGRRLGNMHYKEGVWYTNIEPILYDARLNNANITILETPAEKWNSARIRDKWCKIRVRYSGEDLAVITAIKTILNI